MTERQVFRKGDRVRLAFPAESLHKDYDGKAGTVQQCRSGGSVAVVRLDSGERVSMYQENLVQEHAYGDKSDCSCGRNFTTVRGLREHMTKARMA